MSRRILRVDGTEQTLASRRSMSELEKIIGADGLDTVPLRHLGRPLQVMVVDDLGHPRGRPINERATELYRANCRPGTTHVIRGDVAIVFDEDYA